MDTRTRILSTAESLFKQGGVRSVSMDDIARELGMSKKTIYQYFKNKADIVYGVSTFHFNCEEIMTKGIVEEARDPIEALVLIMEAATRTFKEIPPTMVWDIQKYYPESWSLFHEFKDRFLLQSLIDNLRAGVEAGLYRKDMDVELVARIRVAQIELAFDTKQFPPNEYEFGAIQLEQFALFLHGVVTMKGKRLIYQYLNLPDDE